MGGIWEVIVCYVWVRFSIKSSYKTIDVVFEGTKEAIDKDFVLLFIYIYDWGLPTLI